jgi:spermidine/putrescine transport system substrate-binding protein
VSGRLALLIWPDYVNPATLAAFEQETGVGVDFEIVPSAVELVNRMRAGTPPPDVLVPPDYAVRELNEEGRLAVLDLDRLPNARHIEPRFQRGRPHDPDSRVSVIKDWGTTGYMYRADRIEGSPKSWVDFWELAEKVSGRVTLLNSPGEVIGAALKMRGFSYNASAPEQLAHAREELLRIKPHLLALTTDYRLLLASGDAWLSLGWNGDAAALKARGLPVEYVVPSEGSQIWEDDWAIAANAPDPRAAHEFLNFMLRPDIAAQEARYTHYATGNRSALALLDEEMRQDRATYPAPELIGKLEPGLPLDAAGRQRRKELWDEFRS